MTNNKQAILLVAFAFYSLIIFLRGIKEAIKKNNPYKETPFLFLMGIFVWGDALILAPFWFILSLVTLFLKNGRFFLIGTSVFWLVRSIGETIYWINQQFSPLKRNPPEKMRGYKIIKNDSIWFIYQIFWQTISIAAIIALIYLIRL